MKKIIAYSNQTVWSALVIFEINEDYVTCGLLDTEKNELIGRETVNKLYTNSKGDFYFRKCNRRYYLNEFVRVGDWGI